LQLDATTNLKFNLKPNPNLNTVSNSNSKTNTEDGGTRFLDAHVSDLHNVCCYVTFY